MSPAATYQHLRDRDALIAETARIDFARFADQLEAAWDGRRPSPLAAFGAVGRAYLAFARDEPAYFTAMFEAGVRPESDPALRAEADRAFEALRRG